MSLESTENLEENAQYTEGFSQEKVARGPHGGGGTGFLFFFSPLSSLHSYSGGFFDGP